MDLRTQFNYQRLDQHFVGLIFAVYNTSQTNNAHSYEMISFQSKLKGLDYGIGECFDIIKVPHQIVSLKCNKCKQRNEFLANHLKNEIGRLSVILLEEEEEGAKPTTTETEDPISSIMNNLASSQIQMNIATVITLPTKEDLDLETKLENFVQESHWYKPVIASNCNSCDRVYMGSGKEKNGIKEKSPQKSGD